MTKTKQLALSAVLVALALGLSDLERFLPLQLLIPLPGVKLGLANIVTMMALYFLSGRIAFSVLVVRCLLGSLFGGGLTGLAMSLTGGVFAFFTMILAKKLPFLSIFGVSILGAAAHNCGQVCAAAALLYSGYTFAYLPFLLLLSIPSGLLTGTVSAAAFRTLRSVFPTAVTISSDTMK